MNEEPKVASKAPGQSFGPGASSRALTEVMTRFARGDRRAFDRLFALAWPVVLNYCKRFLSDDHDAEDAAQEALLKVFKRIVDYDCTRCGLTWIITIARFEVLTVRKRKYRLREDFDDFESSKGAAASAEEALVRAEMLDVLARAVDSLSPQDRFAIEVHLSGGSDDQSVGPVDSKARKRKQRAVERLQLVWRKLYGE